MKIGINAQLLTDSATGVARYARDMIAALIRQRTDHLFVLFGNSQTTEQQSNVKIVPTHPSIDSTRKRILWEQCSLPFQAKREEVDVLYYPDHTGPLFAKPTQVVITIHDLSFLHAKGTQSVSRRIYKSSTIKRSIAQADRVIAVSQATAAECVQSFSLSEKKFTVIHNGIAPWIQRTSDSVELSRVRAKYGLRSPMVLYVGTLEKRKNLARLIEAFSVLKLENSIPHQLVLAGGKGFAYDEVVQARARSTFAADVLFTGFVDDADLPALYSLADVFVYPSLYEGFGFPPLEAMACGCPVITSNTTSLPEVVGAAAMTVDPFSVDELMRAMRSLIESETLKERLIQSGRERAKQFSWDGAAARLLNVFGSLSKSKGR